ncbi:MAG: hypothetical protein J6252_04555 [Clostridia bacterium]|nr:hypothetical protein [Clostridia bacterium]
MKKISAILLVLCMVLAFVACGGGNDTSKDESKAAESGAASADASTAESKEDSKEESKEASKDESKEESKLTSEDVSEAESGDDSESEPVDDSEDTVSEPEKEVVFTNKFITWKGSFKTGMTTERINDATSLPLSKINEEVEEGDVGIFTREFGSSISDPLQDYSDFAIGVFEYDHSIFSYKLVSMSEVGAGDASQAIPEDGYVLAIYKKYEDKAKAMAAAAGGNDVIYFPHGITINRGLNVTIHRAGAAPTIDGDISSAEYGNAVWSFNPDNPLINYAQFEAGNYYASAEAYLTYDDEYIYLGVVVDSPYHINTLTESNKGSMWNSESIQVNVSVYPADSDYISEHWDWVIDKTSTEQNVMRQTGYCVNNKGDTLQTIWQGDTTLENSEAKCIRDDAASKTYYEVKIPFSDIGRDDTARIAVQDGTRFGLSISVNSGDGSKFKNIIMRDGGGIISINDWTKIPVITLG